ncbi:hypothetical protein J6590_035954 [Homalodisca vitripennis]|nr:hypothetical protein J6590_035954 [Homalodisca vitripennis]
MAERSKTLDKSELEIAQVRILSVTLALFISNVSTLPLILLDKIHAQARDGMRTSRIRLKSGSASPEKSHLGDRTTFNCVLDGTRRLPLHLLMGVFNVETMKKFRFELLQHEHDSSLQESSLGQHQIPEAAIKGMLLFITAVVMVTTTRLVPVFSRRERRSRVRRLGIIGTNSTDGWL